MAIRPDQPERETTKHGPRLDEAMARDTEPLTKGAPVESRRRDDRLQESGDEPLGGSPAERPGPVTFEGLRDDERALLEQLAERLASARYPSDRNALIRHVGEADERGSLVSRLRKLPADRLFSGLDEVVMALSGASTEGR